MSNPSAENNNLAIGPSNTVLNVTPEPEVFRYEDGTGQLHEKWLAPGKYAEAVRFFEAEDWEALSQFPRYSDQAPLGGYQPSVMSYTDTEGETKDVYLPKGKAERAFELVQRENWATLEEEFEPYTGQKHEVTEQELEYERGVERMRKAREAAEK